MKRRLLVFVGAFALAVIIGAVAMITVHRPRSTESPATQAKGPTLPFEGRSGKRVQSAVPAKSRGAAISAILAKDPKANLGGSIFASSLDVLREAPHTPLTAQDRHAFYAALHRLSGATVTPTQRQSLVNFLLSTERPDALSEQQLYQIKNDILNFLRNEDAPPDDVTEVMLALFLNPAQDAVIRDYAIQHLAAWYDGGHEQPEITDVLWSALAETNSSIAGTALLGLARLSENRAAFDRTTIGAIARDLAADEHVSTLTRTTALQIAAQLGMAESLTLARRLIEGGQDIPLQISAIAAVGTLGSESERTLLETIAEGRNQRLRTPAVSALQRLSQSSTQ